MPIAVFDEALNRADTVNFIERVLSQRELELFSPFTKGLTIKQVALDFGITHKTARIHLNRILAKLGLRNVAEIAILGWRIRHHFIAPAPHVGRHPCGPRRKSREQRVV